jgi:hypothetical protein
MDMYLGSGGPITIYQLDFIILKHMELRPKIAGTWQVFEVANHIYNCRVRGN